MKKYLVLSALLHVFIFIFGVTQGGKALGNKGQEGQGGSSKYGGVTIDKEVIAKDKAITSVEIIEKHPEIIVKAKKKKVIDKDCPNQWYGGIGIETVYITGETIKKVHSGYPADLAGLLPGDVILSVEGNYIPGPPGTVVNILIGRNGVVTNYKITRGKICY